MKKTGIIIIFLIVLLVIAFSSATYAFFSAQRASIVFIVGSEIGSSIGLNIYTSNNAIIPPKTKSAVNDYSAVTTSSGESYAVYIIEYNAASTLDVDFYITDVEYEDSQGQSFSAAKEAYLDGILEYCLKTEANLNTYNLNNLHTLTAQDWKFKYNETNATTKANTSFNFPSIAQGAGYLFCYIRFNVSQELVLPEFDDMTIAFVIQTVINE